LPPDGRQSDIVIARYGRSVKLSVVMEVQERPFRSGVAKDGMKG
jgi:hypothetical protein